HRLPGLPGAGRHPHRATRAPVRGPGPGPGGGGLAVAAHRQPRPVHRRRPAPARGGLAGQRARLAAALERHHRGRAPHRRRSRPQPDGPGADGRGGGRFPARRRQRSGLLGAVGGHGARRRWCARHQPGGAPGHPPARRAAHLRGRRRTGAVGGHRHPRRAHRRQRRLLERRTGTGAGPPFRLRPRSAPARAAAPDTLPAPAGASRQCHPDRGADRRADRVRAGQRSPAWDRAARAGGPGDERARGDPAGGDRGLHRRARAHPVGTGAGQGARRRRPRLADRPRDRAGPAGGAVLRPGPPPGGQRHRGGPRAQPPGRVPHRQPAPRGRRRRDAPVRASRLLITATVVCAAQTAGAAPVLRVRQMVNGDVLVVGSPLAHDCGSAPTPAGASALCTGVFDSDAGSDAYWRDGTADATVSATSARTSADLPLPAAARVKYARLYWSATLDAASPDLGAVLDRPGGFSTPVTADSSFMALIAGPLPLLSYIAYQASADVTALVAAHGRGAYRVSDVAGIGLDGVSSEVSFAAWTLVVIYELPASPPHLIALYDGLDGVTRNTPVALTTYGFAAPAGSVTAK